MHSVNLSNQQTSNKFGCILFGAAHKVRFVYYRICIHNTLFIQPETPSSSVDMLLQFVKVLLKRLFFFKQEKKSIKSVPNGFVHTFIL